MKPMRMTMSRWTMSAIWTLLLTVVTLCGVDGFKGGCVNPEQCHCLDPTRVVCNCTRGGHLNLLTFMIPKNLELLRIEDCDAVAFNPMTFSDTFPRVLHVTNVRELFVRPLAFHKVVGMREIVIRDTVIASLDLHAFTAVHDLRKLEFVNVTLGNVSSMAFSDVVGVGELSIVGCTVDLVATGAFNHTRDVGSIRIRNSTFGQVQPHAVVFENVGDFEVTSSTVEHLMNRSITLDNLTRAEFVDCQVGILESHAIVTLATDIVAVAGCRFDLVRTNALEGLRNSSNVRFEQNHFVTATSGSVPSAGGHSMTFKDNVFTCDSSLCWLLERDQKSSGTFLMDNRCSNYNSSLASFASRIDDEDVCGRDDQSSGHDSSDLSESATVSSSSTEKVAAAASAGSSSTTTTKPEVATFELILSILIFLIVPF